jgi:hypothetical protein
MSFHAAAQHLSKKGRGPDSMLVHMAPEEVHGLQALAKAHGGSLTINPDTGLVEAGFLSQILPVVAAAGLTYLTAGAAAPLMAGALGATGAGIVAGAGAGALINGGMAAMQGKNAGQAALMGGLGGGVAGGLGAYGNADVFNVAGATSPTPVMPTEAPFTSSGNSFLTQTGTQLPTAVQPTTSAALVNGVDGAGGLSPDEAIKEAARQNAQLSAQNGVQQSLQQGVQQGANNIPNTAANAFKEQAANQYYQKLGDTGYAPVQKLGIQALPVLSTLDDQPTLNPIPEEPSKLGRISPNFYAQQPIKPNPYYHAQYADGGTVEQMSRQNSLGNNEMFPQAGIGGLTGANTYQNPTNTPVGTNIVGPTDTMTDPYSGQMQFASGGDVKKKRAQFTAERSMAAMDPYQAGLANLNNARYGANMTGVNPLSSMTSLGDIPTAAGGGLSSLGGFSDGGRMLKGPGDGMSDNIPATIGGKQPARLADGEFVVPADVVSHLGNGSTDAGAKRLYSMMDKVRQARTGKKKQAPAVKTDRFMPA